MGNQILRINNIIDNCSAFIFDNPNIIGLGLGRKIINNKMTKIPTLTFIVEKKLLPQYIPKNMYIPKKIYGANTDVIVGGLPKLFAESNFKNDSQEWVDRDVAFSGVEINNETKNGIGKICYPVKDKNFLYILSCQHVLAPDLTKNYQGNNPPIRIFQPPLKESEGADPINKKYIGVYYKGIPVKLGVPLLERSYNEVDAALAYVGNINAKKKVLIPGYKDSKENKIDKIERIAKYISVGQVVGLIGEEEVKIGAIATLNTLVKIYINKKKTAFKKQIAVKVKNGPRDSGALGVAVKEGGSNTTGGAFGMLMCGDLGLNEGGEIAYFNDINIVLDNLGVELLIE